MARSLDLFQFIPEAKAAGETATAALHSFREAGGSFRTQSWYQAWNQVVRGEVMGQIEPARPLGVRPPPAEAIPVPTKLASGYEATVAVFGRGPEGNIVSTTHSVVSTVPLTPQAAITTAIERAEGISPETKRRAKTVPITILGAMQTGFYVRRPA